jgi:non-homologous end joining protein Ku
MVALGSVVFTTREHVIAIEPRGKGMLGVQSADQQKAARRKVDAPKEPQQARVINLLDALRQSTAAERGAGRAHPRRAVTSGRQKSERRLKRSARRAN